MNNRNTTVEQVAKLCGGRFQGSRVQAEQQVCRVAAIDTAEKDSITWLVEPRFKNYLEHCEAAAVIGNAETLADFDRAIVCDDPQWAMAKLLQFFHDRPGMPPAGIHETAIVDPSATIAAGAAIGQGVVIKAGASIGENTVIHAGASIGASTTIGANCQLFDRVVVYDRCTLGDRVTVHGGTIIGADGFGYIFRENRHVKLMHLGTVIIEDDVEIGANACIDRGKVGATRIGQGAKIDNLVMIAHNVEIGPLAIIIAQCGIAGSCKLGAGAIVAGQAGIDDNIEIGAGAEIGGGAAVVERGAGRKSLGIPARDFRQFSRELKNLRKIGDLLKRLKEMERKIRELEERDAPR